jgi:S-adenosyl-L-methionine hydrolase (adenosine-forming)
VPDIRSLGSPVSSDLKLPPIKGAPLITLTTDFGADSPYVAAMKGVIYRTNPAARVVDVTHSIPPQDVRRGAWVLEEVAPFWPAETVHVVVVDPGVGTSRQLVYARFGDAHYVAPDNGVLSRLARRESPSTIVAITEPRHWLPQVSRTFHGRDILAPVAARLSLGLDPALLGPALDRLVELSWPEVVVMPGSVRGSVRSIDSFGNLITDITADQLKDAPRDPERVRVKCDEHETLGIFNTYGDQPPMTLVALVGSSGYLEIAIVDENASMMLGIRTGTPVTVEWI